MPVLRRFPSSAHGKLSWSAAGILIAGVAWTIPWASRERVMGAPAAGRGWHRRLAPAPAPPAGRLPEEMLQAAGNLPPAPPNSGADELPGICSRLEAAPDADSLERVCCDVLAPWIARNVHAAAKLSGTLEAAAPTGAIAIKAQIMAARNLAAASVWADSLPSGKERESAFRNILYEASVDAPQDVLEVAGSVELNGQSSTLVRRILLRWEQNDRQQAMEWLVSRPGDFIHAGGDGK